MSIIGEILMLFFLYFGLLFPTYDPESKNVFDPDSMHWIRILVV